MDISKLVNNPENLYVKKINEDLFEFLKDKEFKYGDGERTQVILNEVRVFLTETEIYPIQLTFKFHNHVNKLAVHLYLIFVDNPELTRFAPLSTNFDLLEESEKLRDLKDQIVSYDTEIIKIMTDILKLDL